MNKAEFVSLVAEITKFKKVEAERAIDGVLEAIFKALQSGEDVRFLGFGTFAVKQKPATEARNPKTGAKIAVPAKKVARFQPSKALKEALEKAK